MKTAADISPANRTGTSSPVSPATFKTFSIASHCFGILFGAFLFLTAATSNADERISFDWAKPQASEFSLAVFRIPVSLSLLSNGEKPVYRFGPSRTELTLSIAREKEALARIQIGKTQRTDPNRGLLNWGGISAGYGQTLAMDSAVSRGYNAAVFVPKSALYVRTIFTF